MIAAALVAAVLLVAANAFFVWAEFALVASRRIRMEEMAAAGSRRARLALGLMGDLNFVLAGAQLGIGMASLGLGFVAEPSVARLLESPLGFLPESVAHATELGLALVVVVVAHIVLGEMVPKNLAIAEPERGALWLALPFRLFLLAFRPVTRVLNDASNALLRLGGIESREELVAAHSAEEIAVMLETSREGGAIQPFEHRLLSRALGLTRLDARAVMVPRPDVVAVPATVTPAELARAVVGTGHSRFPVYRETLDDVAGFLHVKDLLRVPPDEADRPIPPDLVRAMVVVPETRSLPDLLADMRRERTHFALVVDEHGGTEGVVTLEDVLEELVGEIHDEHDRRVGRVWHLGPRHHLVDAGLRPDELERAVALRLPEGEYDTVGGFVMARLGRLPAPDDLIEYDGWMLRVRRMEGRRVELVEVVAPGSAT